ncbi:MAG: LysE family translocator [Alphaproteobacteria bacterium]
MGDGLGTLGVGWLLSAAAFALAMSATPGPNNAMVAASGATYGFARTVPHILGISVGFPAMLIAVALGAGAVLTRYPVVHDVMRWLGAAYLVWLAWRIATARPAAESTDRPRHRDRPLGFMEAALFQWVNPKAWVIALAGIATYTGSGETAFGRALVLAVVFFVTCVPSTALWTGVGVGAARLLRTERGLRAFNLALAALLVASLATLFE